MNKRKGKINKEILYYPMGWKDSIGLFMRTPMQRKNAIRVAQYAKK